MRPRSEVGSLYVAASDADGGGADEGAAIGVERAFGGGALGGLEHGCFEFLDSDARGGR